MMWSRSIAVAMCLIGFSLAQSEDVYIDNAGCGSMCCAGRNNTCHSKGPKMNGKGGSHDKCFCDEGCLDMLDCCKDYSVSCQAIDCEVSEWGSFGSCSKPCGLGVKTRYREVLQEPKNGGQKCPASRQRTMCLGRKCKTARHLGASSRKIERETARIMPAAFGKYRKLEVYNANMDIRKNIFQKYYSKMEEGKRGYCSQYKITSTRMGCLQSSAPWARVLQKGAVICVECQNTAMESSPSERRCSGHGREQMNTYWNAVNAPGCHGWWTRIAELRECTCDGNMGTDFIFV